MTFRAAAQRNDPCPCGSGKKFKQCCLGKNAQITPASLQLQFVQAQHEFEQENLRVAATGFRHILNTNPTHPDALHYLGLIDYQLGDTAAGLEKLRQSLALDPDNASFLSNLGAALVESGNSAEAVPSLQQAIRLNPGYANAYCNLGIALLDLARPAPAIACLRQALSLAPRMESALFYLGYAQYEQGEDSQATLTLLKLLDFAPNHADAISYLGLLSERMGDVPNAIELLQHAITLKPERVTYHLRLAGIYDRSGSHQLAVECLERAATLPTPHTASILCDIGILYDKLGKKSLAAEFATRALQLNPYSASANQTLGIVHYALGQPEAGIAHYRRAIELAPDNSHYYSNLLFTLQFSQAISDRDLFEEHLKFADTVEAPLKPHWKAHHNSPDPERRLNIGYVSADFNDHSLAMFIRPILARHDKHHFRIHCYYNDTRQDAVTQEMKGYTDHWVSCLPLSDDELAAQIERDAIDILIDLSGHTRLNRLPVFARKPAPIQITWLGYIGTTGLSAMDYRITDQHLDPPGLSDTLNTERLIRLSAAGTLELNFELPAVTPLPSLHDQPFTFACLNSISKISDANIALWSEILLHTPGARLMLGNAQEPEIKQRLIERFAANNISADRLMLMPRYGTYDYLTLYHQIDVALDPYPYNGGTTSIHALLMGVPVISLSGSRAVSRCGATILHAAGLGDFVATTSVEYLAIAQRYFNNRSELNEIRQDLRARWLSGPMGDPVAYTRELENTYRQVWRTWCAAAPAGK